MSYQEEERARLKRQSGKQAIALAMEGRWREAVEANKSLIESFPNDVDSYNRLGRAHLELGEYSLAREAYQKTIDIDPYNIIAQKNLNRLSLLRESEVDSGGEFDKVEPQRFIEEVGKAGVVNLHRLAQPDVLARTVAGGKVNLRVLDQRLVVEDSRKEYLGQVEPRHGQRLIKLIEGGNKYEAAIISSSAEAVSVIIREVYQHRSQAGQPSFPSRGPESYAEDRIGDMMIRRQLEYLENENKLPGETGYAIVDGDNVEVLREDSGGDDEESDSDD